MGKKLKRSAREGEVRNRWVACEKCISRATFQCWEYSEWGSPLMWWIERIYPCSNDVEIFLNDDAGIHSFGRFGTLNDAIAWWQVNHKYMEKNAYVMSFGAHN